MNLNIIHNEDWITGLKKLPDESVNSCVTSPPYFGLRQYLPNTVVLKKGAPDWVKKELETLGILPIDKQ